MTSASRPEVIYHYTTQAGLLGILRDRTLRATDLRFLNDREEYRDAVKIARDCLHIVGAHGMLHHVLRQVLGERTEYMEDPAFVISLSSLRDDVNQWRAYSSGGAGYCIGFDSAGLQEVVAPGFELSCCVYDHEQKRLLITDALEAALEHAHRVEEDGQPAVCAVEEATERFKRDLARLAPQFKDVSFAAEHEWRLWAARPFRPSDLQWRTGKFVPVPYVEIRLPDPAEHGSIVRELMVGPSVDPDMAVMSLEALWASVSEHVSDPVEIVVSAVPYRG